MQALMTEAGLPCDVIGGGIERNSGCSSAADDMIFTQQTVEIAANVQRREKHQLARMTSSRGVSIDASDAGSAHQWDEPSVAQSAAASFGLPRDVIKRPHSAASSGGDDVKVTTKRRSHKSSSSRHDTKSPIVNDVSVAGTIKSEGGGGGDRSMSLLACGTCRVMMPRGNGFCRACGTLLTQQRLASPSCIKATVPDKSQTAASLHSSSAARASQAVEHAGVYA